MTTTLLSEQKRLVRKYGKTRLRKKLESVLHNAVTHPCGDSRKQLAELAEAISQALNVAPMKFAD